jgi:two-component system nitrate/nitrite response regulator NarL
MSSPQISVLVVVEDDPDMRRLVRFVLGEDPRLEVSGEASTGEQGVELARETQPDLVVLDHFLEGPTTGLQVAPLIKEVAPQARIILFSSHDLAVEAGQTPSVDAFVAKRDIHSLLAVARDLLDLTDLGP